MEIKCSPFVRQSTTVNIFFSYLGSYLKKQDEEINFFILWMFMLLEGFQPKYAYKDIERNRVNEEHPETQDQKGNFFVKANSLYSF